MAGIVKFAFPVSVSFFCVLSRYVLSFVYLHNKPVFDKRNFFAARYAGLYPLHFVVLVLATLRFLATEVKKYGFRYFGPRAACQTRRLLHPQILFS
jgi:peptidoglycan/LPS O-acetylase OafA/YrhL